MQNKKLGFWSVFSVVISSMLGTGAFILPVVLAEFGYLNIFGWLISGLIAISLSLVFAKLCSWFPKTGGPHVFIKEAFGKDLAFFIGWTYWVVSWISTTVLVVSAIKYLALILNLSNPFYIFFLELILLFLIIFLNFQGVSFTGKVENLLTILKFIPFVILPILALYKFDIKNLIPSKYLFEEFSIAKIIGKIVVLTFWGFIGVESGTAPAEFVENPKKNIPKALIFGTLFVSFIYIFNTFSILGSISKEKLMGSLTVYADLAEMIFGGSFWKNFIAIISSIICITSINTWTLVSAQVSSGLAEEKFLPKFFSKKNKNDAPIYGILVACLGVVPFLYFMMNEEIASQITKIIDFSVVSFIFIYLFSTMAFLKICFKKKEKFFNFIFGFIALFFCLWIIFETPLKISLMASIFTLIGVPFYIYLKSNNNF